MLNDKILEFYGELREEVQEYVKNNGPISVNAAFKTLFLSYLTEAGETLVSDCTLVDFKRDSENMRLDGYALRRPSTVSMRTRVCRRLVWEYITRRTLIIGKT